MTLIIQRDQVATAEKYGTLRSQQLPEDIFEIFLLQLTCRKKQISCTQQLAVLLYLPLLNRFFLWIALWTQRPVLASRGLKLLEVYVGR